MNRAALANKINQATRTNKKINKKIICITSYSTSRAYGELPSVRAFHTEVDSLDCQRTNADLTDRDINVVRQVQGSRCFRCIDASQIHRCRLLP